jgi:hypothetical protein
MYLYMVCTIPWYVHVYHWYGTMRTTVWHTRVLHTYVLRTYVHTCTVPARVPIMVHTSVPWYTLTAPEPGEQVPSRDDHSWSPQTRTTTETVQREAMQVLVRVQAHMFARIVVEIRAADIADELEP